MENFRQEVERLRQENIELRTALQSARRQIEELLARLSQDNNNSNWPPGRDKSRKKRRTHSLRGKSKRKPDGQPGHEGKTLEFSEHPDEIIVHRPETCPHCQQPFDEHQPALRVIKRQVYDLPPLHPLIYEYQAVELQCCHCGQTGWGTFPKDITRPVQYGARVSQLAVYLKIEHFIPYHRSYGFFADLYGLPISQGTLQTIIAKAATRLTPVVEQIKKALQRADVVNFDESGFYIGGKRHWLHSAGTEKLTYYFPHPTREHRATDAQDILSYRRYTTCRHSLCNAHHLRELQAVVEHEQQPWARHFQRLLVATKNVVAHHRLAGETDLPATKIDQVERIYEQLMVQASKANAPPDDGWERGQKGRIRKGGAKRPKRIIWQSGWTNSTPKSWHMLQLELQHSVAQR